MVEQTRGISVKDAARQREREEKKLGFNRNPAKIRSRRLSKRHAARQGTCLVCGLKSSKCKCDERSPWLKDRTYDMARLQ